MTARQYCIRRPLPPVVFHHIDRTGRVLCGVPFELATTDTDGVTCPACRSIATHPSLRGRA